MAECVVELTHRAGGAAFLALPGALVVFLGFNGGGFFPDTVAVVTVVLVLALAARIIAVDRPFAGFSPVLAVAAVALALYGLWTLLSATWSDSTWRAMIEFDRVLLYLFALLLFGSVPRRSTRIRWMTRGLAVGILIVCSIGLTTRLLPDVWPIAPSLAENRLSYPITYWNSLGLLAALGVILCFYIASSRGEPRLARVLGAGAVPILATTLYFTFSRGGIVACVIGLVAYVAFARPRALLSAVLTCVPITAIALLVAYHADKLATLHPTSAAATDQGHGVALALILCAGGALLLRFLLVGLDVRRDSLMPGLSDAARRAIAASAAAVAIVGAAVGAIAVDLPHYASDQYDRFVHGSTVVGDPSDLRTRLTDPSSRARISHWKVALNDGYEPSKLRGQGAGTFEFLWAQHRPADYRYVTVHDAHSLYVESLGELGLVGLVLIVIAIGAILYGFATRLGGRDRTLYGFLLAAGVAWALRAGVDWDWEMPVVTLWVFMFGGAALAAPPNGGALAAPRRTGRSRSRTGLPARAAAATACLAVGVIPFLITLAESRLNDGVDAFLERDDCQSAISAAGSSTSILGSQPEPYQLEAYCEARTGSMEEAVRDMARAVERDPQEWEYRYGLAVVRAAAGRDPRGAARAAQRLNPFEPRAREIVRRFRTSDPRRWREEGRSLLRYPVL
jgi:O-antigen ligase/polysaccharide polymerase Wzy-like membrane protein